MKNSPSMRVRLAWGRRRAAGEERAPPLPQLSSAAELAGDEADSETTPYPFLYIYDSPAIAMEQKLLRNRDKTVQLPPLPTKSQTT